MDVNIPQQYVPPIDTSKWVIEEVVKMHEVYDGDTVEVTTASGRRLVVHFYYADAPELDQPGGLAARETVAGVMRKGDFVAVRRGQKGRVVYGEVYSVRYRMPLSVMLACAGYAWPTRARHIIINGCVEEARRRRMGIWQLAFPVQPAQWRRIRARVEAHRIEAIVEDFSRAVQE